ncbi:MAG: TolC family protein, partial [Deltaproteobacteria bacterium]|nr:TolC family protein [Deltaproteobacteria bacterium]
MTRFLALWVVLAVLAVGCADAARQKIARPPLAPAPEPQTVFGQATLTDSGDPAALPPLPQVPDRPLNLDDCLEIAQKVNPYLDSADQAHMGALWDRWQAITAFLPTAGANYRVTRYQDQAAGGSTLPGAGPTQYSLQVGVSQPLFAGGQNSARYLLADLGVSAADIRRLQAREDLILEVKQTYLAILATEKALEVARTSVVQLQSHLNVATNFYEVGMSPRNQVLEADVTLARAVQQVNTLEREVMVNKAHLNVLLRRPV